MSGGQQNYPGQQQQGDKQQQPNNPGQRQREDEQRGDKMRDK